MKLLLAFFVVICVTGVYSDPIPKGRAAQREEKINECLRKTKLDPKIFEKTTNDFANTIPKTPELGCFLACVMKNEGVMNDDGTLTKTFIKSIPGDVCANLSGNDECELAFNIGACLAKNHFKK